MPGVSPPPTAPGPQQVEMLDEWIEDAVQAFCRERHARARLEAAVAKEFN
jgi:hypothetical protein